MEYITGFLFVVVLVLLAIIDRERRAFSKKEERFINRIMAKDLEEFRRVTESMEKTHADVIREMEKENELYENMEKNTRRGFRLTG